MDVVARPDIWPLLSCCWLLPLVGSFFGMLRCSAGRDDGLSCCVVAMVQVQRWRDLFG
jgi:hypothetical protein